MLPLRVRASLLSATVLTVSSCSQQVTVLRPAISIERTVLYPQADTVTGGARADTSGAALFRDSTIAARFLPTPDALIVTLGNVSARPISVVWNDASITTTAGRASRVVRIGAPGSSCHAPSAPLQIPPGAVALGSLTACEDAYSAGPTGTVTGSFFLGLPEYFNSYTSDSTIQRVRRQTAGQRFEVLLPVEVSGTRRAYLFRFVVDSVRLQKDTIIFDANGKRVR